jgi:hypothetical protein
MFTWREERFELRACGILVKVFQVYSFAILDFPEEIVL